MKVYSTVNVIGRTHVVCDPEKRAPHPEPNYMSTGRALCGVIAKGDTLADWQNKKENIKSNSLSKDGSESLYYKFHCKFLGFDFKRLQDGRVLNKGEFYDRYQRTAFELIQNKDPQQPEGFSLVNRPKHSFSKY